MSRPLPELLADLLVDRRHLVRQRVPLADLAARVQGVLSEPGSAAYEALLPPAAGERPVAVLAARGAEDVVEAVRCAGRSRLTISPRATGDASLAGPAGELVVRTRALDDGVVHPQGWARVGAGATWAAVDRAASAHGLAPVAGPGSTVVGDVTGGCLGPLARAYGPACDRVRAVEAVTGDGELRRATPTEHPELFFGLRGGTGALGVVTAVELDLVPRPTVHATAWHADAAVLERWRAWSADLPEHASTSVALLGGRGVVTCRWTGPPAEAEAALRHLSALGPVPPVARARAHEHAVLLRDLPREALAGLLRAAGPGCRVELQRLGGALARAGAAPSACCCRAAAYALLVTGPGADAVLDALAPWSTRRLPGTAGPSECYDARTLARLQEAVRTYDPEGVLALGRAISR